MTTPILNPNAAAMAADHACDTSHCTTDFVALLKHYVQAKCDHDFTAMRRHLHPRQVTFGDAVGGWVYRTPDELEAAWGAQVPNWPVGAQFYNTRVIGGDGGGVVFVVDTPEMMGTEIRGIAVVDIHEGAITRWIDYWDSRPLGPKRAAAVLAAELPDDLGEHTLAQGSRTQIHAVSVELQDALSAGDADRAGATFHSDAVFEDHTLRTAVRGRAAITAYLDRAGPHLPYGARGTLRHVVGGDLGGGYEWRSDTAPMVGVNAMELDASGLITYFAAMWDGGSMDDESLIPLTATAVEPWPMSSDAAAAPG